MRPFRFLHAADLHLDSPFRGMSHIPTAIRDVVRSSTFQALDKIVELALRERVHFIVIAGDVYDVEDRSARAQLRFHKALQRLAEAGIAVYIAHGNHDPLSGKRMTWDMPAGVHVFGGESVETFAVQDSAGQTLAHVHGISFATAAVTDRLVQRFQVTDREVFNIGVLHTNVDGATDHDNYAPSSRAELITSGFDYWALGHIHTRAVIHEAPYIVYPGNTQGRNIKETGPRGCYLVDVNEDKSVRLTFCHTASVRWESVEVNVTEAHSWTDVKLAVFHAAESVRSRADGHPFVVRLQLIGRSAMHETLRDSVLLEELAAEWNEEENDRTAGDVSYPFVWIESCKLRTSRRVDIARLAEQDSFLGELLRTVAELRQDPAALAAFVEASARELVHSRTGRYIRFGTQGGQAEAVDVEYAEWLARAEDELLALLLEGSEEA